MLPSFDIDGSWLLTAMRGVSVAALLSVFGTLVFRVFVVTRCFGQMPAPAVDAVTCRLLRITQASIAAGMVAMLAWLALQTADMADAASLRATLAALSPVVAGTDFGHVIALQLAAALAASIALGWRDSAVRPPIALGFAAVALGLQSGHSHAASMYPGPSWLLVSDVVHLLAAGAWLGGLLPLLLVVRDSPPKIGAAAARWFSPMGKLCIGGLTASAVFQGWVLVDSIPGLVGTAYGWMALVKSGLFGVLFAFAAVNRYRLAPALLRDDPVAAKRRLVGAIAVQTGFGLAIVAAAAVLSSLSPAMHEQPVWPFAHLFTLDTIAEDPGFRNEVLVALLALAGAAALLVAAALVRHRLRWAAVVGAAVIAWLAMPHLDLLFVPAYPTSFYHSPTQFAATSIVAGAALFPQHCAMCHGTEGRGDGPAAKGLPEPPADLTAGHLWMHSDGELFWWLSHGIDGPEGGLVMPGFAGVLSDDDRWHLIDYIRAHNSGLAFHRSGDWSPPVQAPELQARCSEGRVVSAGRSARGSFVRVVIGSTAPRPSPGVTTILASPARRRSLRPACASPMTRGCRMHTPSSPASHRTR